MELNLYAEKHQSGENKSLTNSLDGLMVHTAGTKTHLVPIMSHFNPADSLRTSSSKMHVNINFIFLVP
jgi:hypothetical protein